MVHVGRQAKSGRGGVVKEGICCALKETLFNWRRRQNPTRWTTSVAKSQESGGYVAKFEPGQEANGRGERRLHRAGGGERILTGAPRS